MAEDREEQHKGFKVHDRRRFSESGEAREAADEAAREEPQSRETGQAEAAPSAERPHLHGTDEHGHEHGPGVAHDHDHEHGTEINFPTFVISLCTQALAHLGEIPDPATGTTAPDLTGARQLIDILAMLQEKTRGNLDADESNLLEQALYDLRIRFVEQSQKR